MKLLPFIFTFFFILSLSEAKAQNGEPQELITIIEAPNDRDIFAPLENLNDSLYLTLETAYQNNPQARAARAELKVVQEQLDQAQAGFKPTVTANADITHTDTESEGTLFFTDDGGNTSKTGSLNVNQPLYRGGRTIADIQQAKNTIDAQRLSLSAIEQNILYQAAEAYMNVLRDEAVLALNTNNQELVAREKEQAENGFTVGELTRTDVSQAEARLAASQADVISARGDVKRSRAVYQQIVNAPPPNDMAYPATIIDVPDNLDEALSIAETNNRNVLQAKFIQKAAVSNVNSSIGSMLPEVSAVGSLSKSYVPNDFVDEQRQATIGVQASIPLYQAGTNLSRVREARKTVNQRAIEISVALEAARQQTISNWETLKAAEAEVKARQSQIEASRIAREGVQYEAELGQRTTLDALDANQELLDAKVSLIKAKRDEVVARFALAETLGLLVPQKLGFSSITP
jgi:TolC family type I secretion outer membrane protein